MDENLSSTTLDEKELEKQEKAQWREKRKVIRAKKVSRLRPLKNFIWWFTGFLTPIVLVVVMLVVGVSVIPVSTYFKLAGVEDTSEYVSEEVGKGSFLSGIQNVGEYTMEDVPALKMLVQALTDAISGISINGSAVIKVDQSKIDGLKDNKILGDISGFLSEFTGCLSIVATIGTFTSDLGDMGKLPTVKEFEEINSDADLAEYFVSGKPLQTPQMYYYDTNQVAAMTGGASGFSGGEGLEEPVEKNYVRAFNNDSVLVDELMALSQEQRVMVKFYYPALDSVPMVDFPAVFGPRFKMTKISSILEVFSTGNENSIVNKIAGDETIESVGGLEDSDIKLVDVIDPPAEEKPESGDPDYDAKLAAYNKNRDLYNIIKDSTGKATNEEIILADLSNMDTDEITLANIIEAPTSDVKVELPELGDPDYDAKKKAYDDYNVNRTLYDILLDAAGIPFENCNSYRLLKVKHLNNFKVDDIKLSTLMKDSENKIIKALLEEDVKNQGKEGYIPVKVGTIGTRIDNLLVADVYGVECFTTDVSKAKDLNPVAYYKIEEENEPIVYSMTGTGDKYYISKEANVWLFLLYNSSNVNESGEFVASGIDEFGNAKSYKESQLKVGDLSNGISGVSKRMMNSTVKQSYDCGLIDGNYSKIYNMTIENVMSRLNDLIA